jgi:uncharacterized membrane protein YgcG
MEVSFWRRSIVAFAIGVALTVAAQAAEITVTLDRDLIVKLPERVATIVIGNPLIADASLQPGAIMVITGKGFGMTNLIALDRKGAVLMEASVVVRGPRPVSVVYFGTERETYSCTPKCERLVTLGDRDNGSDGKDGTSGSGGKSDASRSGGGSAGGPCNTPDDTAADGSRCGGRAASEREGGRPPP